MPYFIYIITNDNNNYIACADLLTGVEAPARMAPKKMPHKDCAPDDDSRTKCRTFSFFVPGDLDI